MRTALAAVVALCGCKQSHREPATTGTVSAIPAVTVPIKIDGEWDEPDWSKRALRGQFLGDDEQLARPSSEVRLLHDATTLYVGLYAADDNIQSTDAFELAVGARTWTIGATGTLAPPTDRAAIAVDRDGTVDDPSNHDEEWVIELALPLGVTGLDAAPADLRASRCDTPLHQPQRCGQWAGRVRLE